ncbi:MAG: glycosyltransferase family 4 protein [Promethearchaeota archaeon]
MIRIFEHTTFISPKSLVSYRGNPIDRNRTLIASSLPSNKFKFMAFSADKDFPKNIIPLPENKLWPFRLFRFKPDIIHTRLMPSCLRSLKVAKLSNRRIKHLISIHGMPETWRMDNSSIKRINKLIEKADVIHTVSLTTAQEVKEEWGQDAVIIYNGIDIDLFHPNPIRRALNTFNVLFVGRLVSHKHPELIVELAKKYPEINFSMIGQGEMYDEIAKEIKLLDNIKIMQVPYSEMPSIYQKHDVFVFPSTHEGFSNAVLEALASGLPVIAFKASSLDEVVKDQYNGYLCDDLKEMGRKVEQLTHNQENLEQMSINARKSILIFDWKKIIKEYETLFENLASDNF